MAKTLLQGRKPGSGRKPGKGKTLAEGRKPGSGRKKGTISKTLADGRKAGSGRKKGTTKSKEETPNGVAPIYPIAPKDERKRQTADASTESMLLHAASSAQYHAIATMEPAYETQSQQRPVQIQPQPQQQQQLHHHHQHQQQQQQQSRSRDSQQHPSYTAGDADQIKQLGELNQIFLNHNTHGRYLISPYAGQTSNKQ